MGGELDSTGIVGCIRIPRAHHLVNTVGTNVTANETVAEVIPFPGASQGAELAMAA